MPPDAELYSTRPDVLIAVMGPAGSGKTSLINLATGTDGLQVGHGLESCTNSVDTAEAFELDGFRVILFDTPAFDHTHKTGKEVLAIIASAFESQFREGQRLAGIIYTHDISGNRIDRYLKANLDIFSKLCGASSFPNVTIATTMWGQVRREKGTERVAILKRTDGFLRVLLDNNARIGHLFEETTVCVRDIIRTMLRNRPGPLQIQLEMVSYGLPIDDTGSAKALIEKLSAIDEADSSTGETQSQALEDLASRLRHAESRQRPEYQKLISKLEAEKVAARDARRKAVAFFSQGSLYRLGSSSRKEVLASYALVGNQVLWEKVDPQIDRVPGGETNWLLIPLDKDTWEIANVNGTWLKIEKDQMIASTIPIPLSIKTAKLLRQSHPQLPPEVFPTHFIVNERGTGWIEVEFIKV